MDIRDASGNVVFRIVGDKIYNMQGQWVYEKEDSYIYDSAGAWKYEIKGNRIYDTRGSWVLEIVGAQQPQQSVQHSPAGNHPGRGYNQQPQRYPPQSTTHPSVGNSPLPPSGYNQQHVQQPQQSVKYPPAGNPPAQGVYSQQPQHYPQQSPHISTAGSSPAQGVYSQQPQHSPQQSPHISTAGSPPAQGVYSQHPHHNPQQNPHNHPAANPPAPGGYNPGQHPHNHHGKGNLLIAGSGRDYLKAAIGGTIVIIIIGIGIAVGGFVLANMFGYRAVGGALGAGLGNLVGVQVPEVRGVLWHVFAWSGLAIAIGMIGWELIQCIYIRKTEILVFEEGITGVGVGPKYGTSAEDTMNASAFQLEYDRITSVDVFKDTYIIVNAHGKEYLIGATNPQQIAGVVSDKLRQAKLSYSPQPKYQQHW